MKTFRNYLMMLGVALFAVLATGCKSGDDELDPFFQLDNAEKFVNLYKSSQNNAVLIDIRDAASYEADHLDGAINIPCQSAPAANGSVKVEYKYLDSQYKKELGGRNFPEDVLKAAGDKNVKVFLYGNTSFADTRTIAGHVSKIGFGREHTYITLNKYDALKAAWAASK